MKKMIVLGALMSATSANAQSDFCAQIDGAVLINSADEFIGEISAPTSSDSIFNNYGRYGSKYQTGSVWNQYGSNGSPYNTRSPFNKYSTSPPRIIKDRKVVGYLTVNKNLKGAVNPWVLGIVCYDFEPDR